MFRRLSKSSRSYFERPRPYCLKLDPRRTCTLVLTIECVPKSYEDFAKLLRAAETLLFETRSSEDLHTLVFKTKGCVPEVLRRFHVGTSSARGSFEY